MTSPLLPLHLLRRAGILLVAVVVALAFAGKASAGCGDHVVVLKPAGQAKATDTADEIPSPKPPCHGPNCSASPAKQTPAPTSTGAVTIPTAKESVTTLTMTDGDSRPSVRRPFESTSPRPIDRASSIFHPPRV